MKALVLELEEAERSLQEATPAEGAAAAAAEAAAAETAAAAEADAAAAPAAGADAVFQARLKPLRRPLLPRRLPWLQLTPLLRRLLLLMLPRHWPSAWATSCRCLRRLAKQTAKVKRELTPAAERSLPPPLPRRGEGCEGAGLGRGPSVSTGEGRAGDAVLRVLRLALRGQLAVLLTVEVWQVVVDLEPGVAGPALPLVIELLLVGGGGRPGVGPGNGLFSTDAVSSVVAVGAGTADSTFL